MKQILLLTLILISFRVMGQSYQQMGNTLQRRIASGDTSWRFNLGSPGFMYFYDKHQVDSLIGGGGSSYTFNNGIINTSGVVGLGGNLASGGATIGLNGQSITITGNNGSFWHYQDGGFYAGMNDGAGNTANLTLNAGNTIQLLLGTNLGSQGFTLTSGGGIDVVDDLFQKGLFYSNDYSATGHNDPRWIPDLGYISSNFLSSSSGPFLPIAGGNELGPVSFTYNGSPSANYTTLNINPTLFAQANSINLKSVDINGTYNSNGHTGVTGTDLHVQNNAAFSSDVIVGGYLRTSYLKVQFDPSTSGTVHVLNIVDTANNNMSTYTSYDGHVRFGRNSLHSIWGVQIDSSFRAMGAVNMPGLPSGTQTNAVYIDGAGNLYQGAAGGGGGGGVSSFNTRTGAVAPVAGDYASLTETLTNKNLTSGTNTFPTFNQNTTGNAATATTLQTPRNINGVAFDGSANITVTAANPSALTLGPGLTGTSYTGGSPVTATIDQSFTPTWTGVHTFTPQVVLTGGLTTASSIVTSTNGTLNLGALANAWATIYTGALQSSGALGLKLGATSNLTIQQGATTYTELYGATHDFGVGTSLSDLGYTLFSTSSGTNGYFKAGQFTVNASAIPVFTLGSDATGDIWYRNSSGVITRLGIGSGTQVLGVSGGIPAWVSAGIGTVTSITPGYGFTSATPITTSGTLTIDTTKLQTVANFNPKLWNQNNKYNAVQTFNNNVNMTGASNPIVWVDTFTTSINPTTPTANRVVTLPNESGTTLLYLYKGQATLTSGVFTTTTGGVSTTSKAFITFVSPGGTVSTTWQYKAVCTANTITITAITNAGTTDTSDNSVLNYFITN